VLTWGIIEEHEEECHFGHYNCPICDDGDVRCPWKGPLFDLKEHLISNHVNKYWEVKDTLIQTALDIRPNVFYDTVIFTMGELFYRRVENISTGFYGYVQHIGPKRDANKYKYELSLQKSKGPEKVTVCYVTSSCWQQKRCIYKARKCLQIDSNVMEYFVNENRDLKIITKISEVGTHTAE
jgi:hypothetical protein